MANVLPTWQGFNGQFLAWIIVCGLLAIFFLLYFNRVVASIISYTIRTYTWHTYRIYIDIKALQWSLLGGRVFFTGLRYHGENETILIQNGHITWSYWLRRARDAELVAEKKSAESGEGGTSGIDKRPELPCRVNVVVSGLEWFVYNRSAAYDSILDAMKEHPSSTNRDTLDGTGGLANGSAKPRQRLRKSHEKSESYRETDIEINAEKDSLRNRQQKTFSSTATSDNSGKIDKDDLPLMLQLLPIQFKCDKAALVMGNDSTKSILIVKAKSLTGEVDAADCETSDPYRQQFKIQFDNPVLEMREHDGFKEEQLARAVKDKQVATGSTPIQQRSFFRRQRRRMLEQLRNLVPYWRNSVESFSVNSQDGEDAPAEPRIPGSHQWQGLSRYLNDDEEDDKLRWSSVEYASVNTVVESPEAELMIYWDVPGKVGLDSLSHPFKSGDELPGGVNGTAAPAWAIKLSLKGGVVNYGPWADRQRAELQRVFFPGLCKDAVPAKRLPLGADRVPTQFEFYLELKEEVILRVPTREDSKNWKWKKEAITLKQRRREENRRDRGRDRKSAATTAAEQRPYGWLDVKIASNTTVSYTMDMLAKSNGYTNTLKIDLPSTEISTSVNHGLLWKSGRQQISCDLSTPLKWNGLRTWRFDIETDGLELFILRDHIFLLIDLIDDWGSGPPSEYLLFTPFKYLLNLQLRHLKLYLNVNDVNIVNDPTSFEENTFLILSSPCLAVDTCIPLDNYRPAKTAVPFRVTADPLRLSLHLPPWNTQATFLVSKEIGYLENLVIDGKYHYNTTTSPANTDTLVLDVSGQSPMAYLYGFLIRYLLQMKDNYFGDHIHFRTLDEHQEALRIKAADPEAQPTDRPPHKKSNDLDVMLNIRADDPRVYLPANMYSAKRHILIEAATLGVDLRFTNYYMDLEMNFSPLSLSLGNENEGAASPLSTVSSSTQLFIDGFNVYGHRLFGLPPIEPTYLCNWDLKVGSITGDCSTDFLTTLIRGGKAFGFSFDDDENALIPYSSVVMYDVTFLRVLVQSVQVWVHVEEAAFLFSTGAIDVNYNDWARTHYSRRADIKVPDVEIACVNSESATRRRSRLQSRVDADVLLRTNIHFALIGRKYDFAQERRLQQELIRRHDQRTHRTDFLLLSGLLDGFLPDPVDVPAQSIPPVPQPALSGSFTDKKSVYSLGSSKHSGGLRRKSSFLSLASSSNQSVIRQGSVRTNQRSRISDRNISDPTLLTTNETRQPVNTRDYPASAGRYSASFGAYGEPGDTQDTHHTSITFSSQYFSPSFPLLNVRPDAHEAAVNSIEEDENDTLLNSPDFNLEDIDPDQLSQDSAHQSLLLELPAGITVFLNAPSLRSIASLIRAITPSDPEDILDTLQVEAVTNIFDAQKQAKINGTLTDFVVRLPQANLRFLNCAELDSADPSQEPQDQYDISLKSLVLATRSKPQTDATDNTPSSSDSRLSFHFRLASMQLSAAEKLANLDQAQAAVLARVERIMVSMGSKEVNYIDADVGDVHVSSSSGKVEYLASLIHRTNMLASETGELFTDTLSVADDRLKQFTYRVITEGHQASDASFVVRPSAILRTAPQHLRTYDSWKLVTRLRQMWSTLDPDAKENLRQECLYRFKQYPADARQQVTAAFEKWRSWDLEDPRHAVLLNNIFGKASGSDTHTSNQIPMMAVTRIQELQFVLDPGPKQNEIYVTDFTVRVQEKNSNEGGDEELANVEEPLTLVNVYCSEAGIKTNWELCELVEDILRLYKKAESSASKVPQPKQRDAVDHVPSRPLHVVAVLGEGAISLEAINLSARLQSSNLKLSVLTAGGPQGSTNANLVLGCDSATSRIKSHSQVLATTQLQHPSVIIAHEVQSDKHSSTHIIKAAASSQDLEFIVKQDPIVLAEVLDLLVKDEVAQLYALGQGFPTNAQPEPEEHGGIGRLSTIRLNLAMFLDSYTITLPLLRSLTYTISGVVARANMAADFGKEIILDFDIKENSHDMQIDVNNAPRSISLLQIPPTNGRITSHMAPGEHSVAVLASLELVELDASAVYSLLTALNRPEISNAISDLQQQIKIIQDHIDEIFGSTRIEPAKPASLKSNNSKLTYVVHASLAGLEIWGIAPIKSDKEMSARLSFCLDTVQIQLANRVDGGPILENPEIRINLHQILFNIEKGSREGMTSCGNLAFGALITATSRESEDGIELRSFDFKSDAFEVNLSSDTVSTFVDVVGYMGDKIKDIDTSRELEYLRKLRQSKPRIAINDEEQETESDILDSFLSSIMYSFEIRNIQLCWLVSTAGPPTTGQEDLVLSFKRIEFATRKKNSAKLTIEDFQLQMVPPGEDKSRRSQNSALLPEVIFNIAFVSTADARRLAFQAVGKSLDLRLTSAFIVPAAHLKDSITLSVNNVQQASEHWAPIVLPEKQSIEPTEQVVETRRSFFGSRRLESLLIDADFAGAVVYLSGKKPVDETATSAGSKPSRPTLAGKYGQFSTDETGSSTVLRTPGLAWKTEYRDDGKEDPTLYGEIKVDPSRNVLYPTIVPLIMEITSSVKEVVGDDAPESPANPEKSGGDLAKTKSNEDDNILTTDPSAVLGRMKLNLGLRICKQEFTLSCQPIGRVAATARFDDIYITMNTVQGSENGNFFAISGTFSGFHTSVQHVYSRESTGSFGVDSIVLSMMNSKHVSGTSGLSAILKVSPMEVAINAKQLQDFLLFREIWIPGEIRQGSSAPVATVAAESMAQGHLVQRYQQVAATAAFPWTATISIAALNVVVDLGQSLGKSKFAISEFWVSSKKTSDWEQNLCLGFKRIGVDCTGRLSGFVALQDFKLRTSIEWPEREQALNETPRIQASISFNEFRLKIAFDYQAFLVADITKMEFLMYNVRQQMKACGDRLVAMLDGESVQVFGTTTSAAQSVALWQAIQKLIQERKASYETSLRDIEKFMKRKSLTTSQPPVAQQASPSKPEADKSVTKSPISLDTDVVVTLKALNLGIFPSTFSDHQVFKLEALNAQARFEASMEEKRIRSILGLTLGQLRIGLAGVRRVEAPKAASEISVEDVVASATGSRGGTILKVPKVEAMMQTWQSPESRSIEYIFKSSFEGKVEVGWNYSRISYIRGMWANHSKALAQTWGREIPAMSAIKVTGVPEQPPEKEGSSSKESGGDKQQQQKITAEVNVPQSKYEYVAREPPVIETPQLRDMGEATPPLEWIGLHRDRLPNLTHQIVIVSLLELAGEVEDAYAKILGSS